MSDRIPVPTWGGEYSVSEEGEVWSEGRVLMQKNGIPRTLHAKPLSARVADNGYLQVGLRNAERGRKTMEVHRVVAWAYYGPQPEGMCVRHLDGDRMNNRPENLAYGTYTENMADTVDHGTNFYQSRSHCDREHEYIEGITFWKSDSPRGISDWRACRACSNALSWISSHPEHAPFVQEISDMYYREMIGLEPKPQKWTMRRPKIERMLHELNATII